MGMDRQRHRGNSGGDPLRELRLLPLLGGAIPTFLGCAQVIHVDGDVSPPTAEEDMSGG